MFVQYLGGKKRLAKHIAAVLEQHREPHARFVDVFAGSLAITAAMSGERVANDGCTPLITLYRAWSIGWRPSIVIDERVYQLIREKADPFDPLTAFAGFGLSYGGKWFGGFARDHSSGRDYARTATQSLDKYVSACKGVHWSNLDFRDIEIRPGDLVYCDPPYRGTTQYGYFDGFNYEGFVTTVQRWADMGATVFVSEYAPGSDTWLEVASWEIRNSALAGKRVERLYRVLPK